MRSVVLCRDGLYDTIRYDTRAITGTHWTDCRAESWRGPALGGVYLGIRTAISQTRGFVPMSARQSVHGMPVIAGSIELARRYRTSYQRALLAHHALD